MEQIGDCIFENSIYFGMVTRCTLPARFVFGTNTLNSKGQMLSAKHHQEVLH